MRFALSVIYSMRGCHERLSEIRMPRCLQVVTEERGELLRKCVYSGVPNFSCYTRTFALVDV